VDAVTDDRGQALAVAVLALAVAAVTVTGLRAAQDRIVADALRRRAAEAAVEAAGASVADDLAALLAELRDAGGRARLLPSRAELEALVSDPLVHERAAAAAERLAAANGAAAATDLAIALGEREIVVALDLAGRPARAALEVRCCRP
jgi:hypothetical protein